MYICLIFGNLFVASSNSRYFVLAKIRMCNTFILNKLEYRIILLQLRFLMSKHFVVQLFQTFRGTTIPSKSPFKMAN